jgi:hypothetical protein
LPPDAPSHKLCEEEAVTMGAYGGVPRPRRRRGLGRAILILAGLGVVYLLLVAAFDPWAFFLGGHFHVLPVWLGEGTLHTSTGDYQMALYVYPSSSRVGDSVVAGTATLCAPSGQRFAMKLWGDMGKRFRDANLEGRPIHFQLHTRPIGWRIKVPDYRPRLDLRGQWTGDGLELNDGGSLSRAFLPDGEVYKGPLRTQPAARETVQVRFHESSWSGYMASCQAGK